MLGFVSALSSTVAILIIVVAMSMLNSFLHILDEQKKYSNFTSNGISSSGVSYDNPLISQNSILPIKAILNIVDDKKVIFITCTYGKNFSKDVADKFLTYNFLKIKVNLPKREVKASLVLEKNKINNCSLGE